MQESPSHLEKLDIHNGSKQDIRMQPALNQQQEQGEQLRTIPTNKVNIAENKVSKGQDVTGIDSMLPPPKPLETVIVVEEAVGGMDEREQETTTNLQEGISGTQEIIDTGQQPSRLNNKFGKRLSKKRREAIKKRLQKNTGQDLEVIGIGTPIKDHVLSKDQQGRLIPDDYGALNSEDEVDPDNQSMDASEEDADDTMKQTGPSFGSNLQDKCSDVQRVTVEQGLSPRGRKQTRHNPHLSITIMSDTSSRRMTMSKSKGY
ncbi:hypothetical protein KY285_023747 [Solanum tuberosum]|nr:hypothetical protein KY285_023747 [Solanum tuberosum]